MRDNWSRATTSRCEAQPKYFRRQRNHRTPIIAYPRNLWTDGFVIYRNTAPHKMWLACSKSYLLPRNTFKGCRALHHGIQTIFQVHVLENTTLRDNRHSIYIQCIYVTMQKIWRRSTAVTYAAIIAPLQATCRAAPTTYLLPLSPLYSAESQHTFGVLGSTR